MEISDRKWKKETNLKTPRASQNQPKSFLESTSKKSGKLSILEQQDDKSMTSLKKSSTVREEFNKIGSTDELFYQKNIFFNSKQGGRPRMQIKEQAVDNHHETREEGSKHQ